GGKEWLKYFIQHILWNSISIIANADFYKLIQFFCTDGNRRLKCFRGFDSFSLVTLFSFSHSVEGVIKKIQKHPSHILSYHIYFWNAFIKISFHVGIETFVFCS